MKVEETGALGFTNPPLWADVISHSDGGGKEFPRLAEVPDLVGITFDGREYHPIFRASGSTPCGYDAEDVYHVERWQVDGRFRPCEECFVPSKLDIEIPEPGKEGDLAVSRCRFRNGGCPMCGEEFDDYMGHLVAECEGEQ